MQRKWKRNWRKEALRKVYAGFLAGALLLGGYSTVLAAPQGGTVAAGSATISQNGATTTINQASQKAVINWNSFNIAKGEMVRFNQPGAAAIALNRVTGNNASAIYGTLSANGQVFLVNPNGVLFAKGAQVNVGGLAASTLGISDKDFLNGSYQFSGDSSKSVVNQGELSAATKGYIALVGANVANEGVIVAKEGTAALGAGSKVNLDFTGDGLLQLSVDKEAVAALASNKGLIQADGGLVVMSAKSADALAGTVVNNSGIIEAKRVSAKNGVIRLEGGANGTVVNSGSLNAAGLEAGQSGGTVKVLGDKVSLTETSLINASGDAAGGTILAGGNYQGSGTEQRAKETTVAAGASLKADAVTNGNGGTVVVLADEKTSFGGAISAKGGSQGGDGGKVETSGKQKLKVGDAARVDTTAAKGKTGSWLLDPEDFTIGTGATGTNYWNNSNLQTALGSSNITITTTQNQNTANGTTYDTASGSGNGDINIIAPVNWSANKLTLSAYRNINIKSTLSATGTSSLDMTSGTGVSGSIDYGQAASGFTGKVNFGTRSGNGFLRINNQDYTVIASLGAAGSTSETDLQGMNGNLNGKYFLGADINASSTSTWKGSAGFAPIGDYSNNFAGVFDGGGHTITGMTINRPTADYVGLFGKTWGATLGNLSIVNADISGQNSVGSLAGQAINTQITKSSAAGIVTGAGSVGGLVGSNGDSENSSNISNSYATASVTGNFNMGSAGGLAGSNSGSISSSYATGIVTGAYNVGGLVGSSNGSIINSYATGSVTGNSSSMGAAGGLVGSISGSSEKTSSIINSYATSKVAGSKPDRAGGLVGSRKQYSSITNSYWDIDLTGQSTSAGGTGLTSDEMKVAGKYNAWDKSIWHLNGGHTAPLLKSFLKPLTVSVVNASKEYTGSVPTVSLVSGSYDSSKLGNALTWAGNGDVGTYGLSGELYTTSQQGYLASYDPSATLTITPKALTISGSHVYDGTTTATGSDFTGGVITGVNGQTLQLSGSGTMAEKNVGARNLTNVSALTLADGSGKASNYTLSGGSVNITPRVLTASVTAANKVYDGNTFAITSAPVLGNKIEGDVVGCNIEGDFSDKNVGVNKTVTFNISLNGTDAGNYALAANSITSNASITKAPLTITAVANTKTYDGGTSASTASMVTSGTVYDAYTLSEKYGEKKAGSNKLLIPEITFATASDAANYAVTAVNANTGAIYKAALTARLTGAVEKVYDGNTTATLTNANFNVNGKVSGDEVLFAGSGSYDNKNIGNGKSVTVPTYTLDGADAGNYYVQGSIDGSVSGKITARPLTATVTAANKVYDGTTAATISGGITLGNFIAGDGISAAYTSGAFADKNVGDHKTVTLSGIALDGIDKGNYTLAANSITSSARITPATLTITAKSDSKVYDGTTGSAMTPTYTGLVSGESLGNLTQAYASKNVLGEDRSTLQVSEGYTLTDGNGGNSGNNYQVTVQTAKGTITPAALTASLTGTVEKVYDGNTMATLQSANGALHGVVTGDSVNVSGTGSYDSKDAGTGKNVTVTLGGLNLVGADAGNYSLSSTSGSITGKITPATLYYTATSASMTQGSAVPTLSGTITGIKGSDVLGTVTAGTAAWSTTATNTSPVGQYSITGDGVTVLSNNYKAVLEQAAANATALTIQTQPAPTPTPDPTPTPTPTPVPTPTPTPTPEPTPTPTPTPTPEPIPTPTPTPVPPQTTVATYTSVMQGVHQPAPNSGAGGIVSTGFGGSAGASETGSTSSAQPASSAGKAESGAAPVSAAQPTRLVGADGTAGRSIQTNGSVITLSRNALVQINLEPVHHEVAVYRNTSAGAQLLSTYQLDGNHSTLSLRDPSPGTAAPAAAPAPAQSGALKESTVFQLLTAKGEAAVFSLTLQGGQALISATNEAAAGLVAQNQIQTVTAAALAAGQDQLAMDLNTVGEVIVQ